MYFIHLDNPEKHQYSPDDIKCHGGFEIEDIFKKSNAENREIIWEIIDFCIDNEIYDFCDLVEVVRGMRNADWLDIIASRNSLFISQYLKSRFMKYKYQR